MEIIDFSSSRTDIHIFRVDFIVAFRNPPITSPDHGKMEPLHHLLATAAQTKRTKQSKLTKQNKAKRKQSKNKNSTAIANGNVSAYAGWV